MISEIISTVKQLNFLLLLTTFQMQGSIKGQLFLYYLFNHVIIICILDDNIDKCTHQFETFERGYCNF